MATVENNYGHPKKVAFLAAFARCGIVSQACRLAEVGRSAHYQWLHDDPEYVKAFEDSKQDAIESLEKEAIRRARKGWLEPIFHEGAVCGHKRKYSDTLLIFILKGAAPDKYRERLDATVKGSMDHSGAIVHNISGLDTLLAEPNYVNYLRERTRIEDCDAGLICQIREPGNGQAVANGQAHGDFGPGANGHRNGSE